MNELELEFHWVWFSSTYQSIDHMPSTLVFSLLLSVKRIRRRRIPREHRCIRRLRLQAERPGSDEVGRGVWAQFLLPAAAAGQADVDGETESQVSVHTDWTLCHFQLWSLISVLSDWIKLFLPDNHQLVLLVVLWKMQRRSVPTTNFLLFPAFVASSYLCKMEL